MKNTLAKPPARLGVLEVCRLVCSVRVDALGVQDAGSTAAIFLAGAGFKIISRSTQNDEPHGNGVIGVHDCPTGFVAVLVFNGSVSDRETVWELRIVPRSDFRPQMSRDWIDKSYPLDHGVAGDAPHDPQGAEHDFKLVGERAFWTFRCRALS